MSQTKTVDSVRTLEQEEASLQDLLGTVSEKATKDAKRFAVGYCAPRFN